MDVNACKMQLEKLDWKSGLLPTVVQDGETGEVLMLAYSSPESLGKTLRTKNAWFYSRSRKKLWQKGEQSGNKLRVSSVSFDCDGDSLLFQARLGGKGVACHTGARSCFDCGTLLGKKSAGAGFFAQLYRTIVQRKRGRVREAKAGSYVASIVNDRKEIASKLREECRELVEAMREKRKIDVAWECADVVFFSLVALANRGVGITAVARMLEKRVGKRRRA
ncbi:MAG: bifunctional phosphoribosyl-AMP cyclohydrolase/phosphoribosyl-ATP diphosphatase HisIE [Candidatus Micrarchaeia archaeon]|jgi:phosphoribosyl-ATP pyrophosphohydrolase/phosphoribosyl-AMP cyclohydrolase